ncbi:hypothetical protein Tco_0462518 [Tanacetum coccineum]
MGVGGSRLTWSDKEVTMQYLELKGGDRGDFKLLGDVIEVLGCLLEAHFGEETNEKYKVSPKTEEEKGTQTLETVSQLLVTASEHQRDGVRKFETASGLNSNIVKP